MDSPTAMWLLTVLLIVTLVAVIALAFGGTPGDRDD